MELFFATSNKHKFQEAQEMLGREGIALLHHEFRHREIRSDSLEEIALEAASAAFSELKKPVIVEDAGLFVDSLNGFPGAYSGWVQEKIGNAGLLRLLEGIGERSAEFRAVVAFSDGIVEKAFMGTAKGRIAEKMMGESGFGYDPIFVPEGFGQSFAQSIALKNKLSHRYQSLLKLVRFLKEEYLSGDLYR